MHGVLITFDCPTTLEDLRVPFSDYAKALRSQPGLSSKAWIVTETGYGGFHVFADRLSADHYLAGELAAGLMATDGFTNFQVTHFDVIDELSAINGIHPVPA